MSKSRGNVQDPDDLVARYGADTVRLFLMFMGPWDQGGPWSPTGIEGVHRFLRRVWTLVLDPMGREGAVSADGSSATADGLLRHAHRALAKVTEDHADFRWNTMISALMELSNQMSRVRGTDGAQTAQWRETVRMLLLMLAPIAPHIAEELWSRLAAARGEEWTSVHAQRWPEFDPALVAMDQMELPIQVNGRLRDIVTVGSTLSEAEIEQLIMARDKIKAQLDGNEVVRVIHVPGRLVNVVVRPRT
jgi:leucyl-tRNA synthetase